MASWNKKPPVSERDAAAKRLLDAVSFDTSGWQFDGEDSAQMLRQWVTSEDDLVSLNFFSLPPDLPTSGDFADFERGFAVLLEEIQGNPVELQIRSIAGMNAVRQIIKGPIPDQTHGLIYVGSWILPFEKFSYVLKVHCIERGITGIRETILLTDKLAKGAKSSEVLDPKNAANWNPDAPEFDAEFPTHPISRVRRIMQHLRTTTKITDQLRGCTPFPLPPLTH